MINYTRVGKIANLKYICIHFYKKNILKVFIIAFLIILFLLTGLFTALKITDMEKALKLVEFSFESLIDGDIYSFSFFIKRYSSILLVMALLFVFATNKITCFLGYLLIGYRAFLLALNCTLIVMNMGIGGAINSIIIILPCQLVQLILMSLFFLIVCSMFNDKKNSGTLNKNYFKPLIYTLIVALLVNIIELLLLLVFRATSILII